ncbi:MAG TPA: MFS transporter [Beijerinckiaceae bacterium]|nr:MFS transporter [Beijerinckiaceae bacterium]
METITARPGDRVLAQGLATRVRWSYVAPTLLVVWIVSMFDKSNMAIVMNNKPFLSELGLVGQQYKLGWLSSGLFLAYGIFAPLWGLIVDRIGPRRTAAISLIIWALTCFWSGVAQNYQSLLLSRIVLGAGEAALYPITLALVANWFALKERGRATSFWWIGTMIGPMLAGLLVTGLVVSVGWRWQFHAMGILALILPLPMVLFLVKDRPQEHSAANAAEADLVTCGALERNEDAPGRALRTVRSTWSNYRFWLTTIAISSNAIFFWGWSIWLPTYLRTARHFSFSTSGYLTFVIFGFAVATILLVGHLSDRIFRRAPLAGLGWVLAAAFLMGAALAPTPWLSVVLMICALCAQQVGISCAEMLMHSIVTASNMGRVQGVRAFVTQGVGSLSPALIGYIIQRTGGFTGAFAVLAVAVVISAGCMVTLAREGF